MDPLTDPLTTFEFVVIVIVAADVVHWAFRRRGLVHPPTGRLGSVVTALLFAEIVLAPLTLFRVVSGSFFLVVLGCYVLGGAAFSTFHRERLWRAARASAVA